ncbi:uncharacterized protein LOC111832493 [Capsella rubella]|uniref:uncharacterized protein LOC111832493 n=1 Tax=Capsella rubella TaxID=81985 RepID=UPI000CD563BA|nr:uncharacterized protein LOC111832493 [Capsella rubella]
MSGHYTARVSWITVTKPKDQGGLGIRDLYVWNKASIIKLIWLLFFQSGSVWVAWFRLHFLKGSLNNFWTMKKRQNYSWLANKLLKYRGVVYDWIKMRIGNGLTCRFWTDNWSPFGKLLEYFTGAARSRMGIPIATTLSQLYRRGQWMLSHARTENQVSLLTFLTTLTLNDQNDYYEWELEGKTYGRYSTGAIYHLLREDSPIVPWSKVVWFSGGIPKHIFHAWLLVLNRCPTRDRMLRWGLQTKAECLLCNNSLESRDHLFFNCSYSWIVWAPVAVRCGLQPNRSWDRTLNHLQALTGPRANKRLSLLVWQCSLYLLWGERNNRLHRQSFKSADSLRLLIDSIIRNRIASFRDSNHALASSMFQRWISSS